MAFNKHVWASANGLETNDVIENRRHWLAVARGGRAAYTIYSILEITAAVYVTIFTTQRNIHWHKCYGILFCEKAALLKQNYDIGRYSQLHRRIPRILQCRGFTEGVSRNFPKGVKLGSWKRSLPEAEEKCDISAYFWTFSCRNLGVNEEQSLDNIQFKKKIPET